MKHQNKKYKNHNSKETKEEDMGRSKIIHLRSTELDNLYLYLFVMSLYPKK